jgi:HAD superfamily phosphatase (TIGR01681 family)
MDRNFTKIKGLDMIVFDLDYTLLNWSSRYERGHALFPYVVNILAELRKLGYKIALVSFNSEANYFLEYHGISNYFDYVEYEKHTFGASKRDMLLDLKYKSGIQPENMLFFDDNKFNIALADTMGIKGYCVKSGIDIMSINNGISKWKCA